MAGAERRPYQSSGMYSLSAAIAAARDTREHEDKLRRASRAPLVGARHCCRRDGRGGVIRSAWALVGEMAGVLAAIVRSMYLQEPVESA